MQDDGHRKSPLRSAEQSLRAVLSLRRRDKENSNKSFRVLMDIGAPPYAAAPVAQPNTVAKE